MHGEAEVPLPPFVQAKLNAWGRVPAAYQDRAIAQILSEDWPRRTAPFRIYTWWFNLAFVALTFLAIPAVDPSGPIGFLVGGSVLAAIEYPMQVRKARIDPDSIRRRVIARQLRRSRLEADLFIEHWRTHEVHASSVTDQGTDREAGAGGGAPPA